MTTPPPAPPPRERILAAALTVFSARGVAGSSIQEVADAAGMSKQALMYHFPTKALLHEGVYTLLSTRLREGLPPVAAELVSRSMDRYRVVLEVVLRRFGDEPEVSRFLVFELLEAPEQLLGWLRVEASPWLGLIRGVADQWQTEAEGVDVEAHVTMLVLMMLAHSALVPRTDPAWRGRVESAAARILQLGSGIPAPGVESREDLPGA